MNKQYTFFSVALLLLLVAVHVRLAVAETVEPISDSKEENATLLETTVVDDAMSSEALPEVSQELGDVIDVSMPQTSTGLSEVVSKVMDRVQDKSGADFCSALTNVYSIFTEDAKRSLAWSSESYESILNAQLPTTVSGAHRIFYEQAVAEVRETNTALQTLHASVAMDTNAMKQAFVRSALLGYLRELHQAVPNATHIDATLLFLENVSSCLEVGNVNVEHENFMLRIRNLISAWQGAREHIVARAETLPTASALEGEGAHLLFIESVRANQDEQAPFFPMTVQSEAELQQYIEAFIGVHPEITRVIVLDDMLQVYYQDKGKLLGFIPVSMKTRAEVLKDTVKIRFPWYGFLTAKERLFNSENLEKALAEVQPASESEASTTEEVPTLTLESLIEQHINALIVLAHELAVKEDIDETVETPVDLPVDETLTDDSVV